MLHFSQTRIANFACSANSTKRFAENIHEEFNKTFCVADLCCRVLSSFRASLHIAKRNWRRPQQYEFRAKVACFHQRLQCAQQRGCTRRLLPSLLSLCPPSRKGTVENAQEYKGENNWLTFRKILLSISHDLIRFERR